MLINKIKGRVAMPLIALLFLAVFTATNLAVAQTPPQIPGYELPPAEQSDQNIIIPSEPDNQGTEQTQPSNSPPPPTTQPDYTLIAIASIAAAAIVAVTVVWVVSRRKVATLPAVS